MKVIRQLTVAAMLCGGLVGVAQARIYVDVGAVVPVAPVVGVYVPPPRVYYAPPPPPPVYSAPVVVGYYSHPHWYPHYYGWHSGYGYWRRW